MSHITEVLIHGAGTKNVEALNAWLREADTERGQQFERIDMDAAGGSKFYASEVWAAAFNYGPVELIEKLRDPETWKGCLLSVGLLIDGENQSEAFFFDGSERDGYRPVMRQDWWA